MYLASAPQLRRARADSKAKKWGCKPYLSGRKKTNLLSEKMGGGGGNGQKKCVFVQNKVEIFFWGGGKCSKFFYFFVIFLVLWVDIFSKILISTYKVKLG